MDAVQTNLKRIAFFLAIALSLIAPFQASAQPTLAVGTTQAILGVCSESQNLTVTSSDGSNQPFSAYIQYAANNPYGNWLYVKDQNGDSTQNSTPFSTTTTVNGMMLTIGLNLSDFSTAAPQATVVLTPNDGTAAVNITVYFTQNTSCGGNVGATNNIITVTPGTISLTAVTNGQQAQTVSIQNLTGASYVFTPTVTPPGTWLTVSDSSNIISADGTTTVTVTANALQTSGVGNYTGSLVITPNQGYPGTTLNIPVNFTVTNGSSSGGGGTTNSGTLTIGNTSTNAYTAPSFNLVAPNAPGGQCINLQDTAVSANSPGAYYVTSVSTSNGGSWLYANYSATTQTTSGLFGPSSNACVELSLSNVASTLASGAYQGQVAITSISGSTATIYVNLYVSAGIAPGISVSPSAIYVFQNIAPNSGQVQQQLFSVTAQPGYVLGTAQLNSSANGFSMTTPSASNNTETFTVTSNPAGLTTGVYSTTVTIPSSFGSSSGSTTITIVLPVGQTGVSTYGGGGTTTSIVEPPSLAFQQQYTSPFWDSGKEAQAITITGQQGSQWSATVVYGTGNNWLTFDQPNGNSGTFGNTPATLLVDLFNGVTNLAPSTTPYQATVYITTSSGQTAVPVTLLVTQSNSAVLLGIPASATFSTVTGSASTSQTVSVVGSDNPSSTTSPPISAGTPTAIWVTATTSGNTMTITVNPSGQSTGVVSATIPVSSSAYANPIEYPVVMIVNGGGGGGVTSNNGPLTLTPTSLSFPGVNGQISQNLSITAATATQYTASSSETTCNTSSWLQIPANTYNTATTSVLSVTVNSAGIANGTNCVGVISLVTTNSTQTVSVSMTVGTASSGGNVTLTPTSLQPFSYTQGQTVPSAQTVAIASASGSASIPFTVAATETSGQSTTWLIIGTTSASTPYTLSVSVAPQSLSPGNYTGTVTITPTNGTVQTIPVSLTVTGSAVVSATPTTVSMSYTVGGTSPTATIQVTGGGASAGFTATATSSAGWLAVSPTSGTTPNTGTYPLTVSIVPTVLSSLSPAGSPYTGSITVAGTSPATGSTIVQVTLTVTAPLPAINGVTNAGSFATGAVSPGEIISIFAPQNGADPIGPATPVSLNSSTCPSPCTQVPTTMGGVTVKFLPGSIAAPILAVSAGQINAIVPYSVASIANLSVEVTYLGQTSNAFPLTVAATAPGLFTATVSGTGQIAANQYDNTGVFQGQNLASSPAKAGWILVLYLTGEGVVSPLPNSGAVTGNTNIPVPLVAPTVRIGNQPATVVPGGYLEAPGLVSGVLQINVIVPANAGTGAVPISVTLGNASTQANVTVSLQ